MTAPLPSETSTVIEKMAVEHRVELLRQPVPHNWPGDYVFTAGQDDVFTAGQIVARPVGTPVIEDFTAGARTDIEMKAPPTTLGFVPLRRA